MRVIKSSNNQTKIELSESEWRAIGNNAGFSKESQYQVNNTPQLKNLTNLLTQASTMAKGIPNSGQNFQQLTAILDQWATNLNNQITQNMQMQQNLQNQQTQMANTPSPNI